MTEVSPAAVAAAAWWAEAVRAPSFNNGDPMAGMLASMVDARRPDANPEQRESFADLLAKKIQADLDRQAGWDKSFGAPSVTLGVDYGPDHNLAEVARAAGINTGKFPWKTTMWVRTDYVTVSAGYQSASQLVWASEEWLANRPLCDSQKWDESKPYDPNYHGEPWRCSLPKYHDERQHVYDRPLALCATCHAPEVFYHSEERDHMPDFHEFVAPSAV